MIMRSNMGTRITWWWWWWFFFEARVVKNLRNLDIQARASDGDGKFLLQLCVCKDDGKRVRMDGISRNVIFIDSSLLPLHTRSPVVDQIPNRISNWRDWREGKKKSTIEKWVFISASIMQKRSTMMKSKEENRRRREKKTQKKYELKMSVIIIIIVIKSWERAYEHSCTIKAIWEEIIKKEEIYSRSDFNFRLRTLLRRSIDPSRTSVSPAQLCLLRLYLQCYALYGRKEIKRASVMRWTFFSSFLMKHSGHDHHLSPERF